MDRIPITLVHLYLSPAGPFRSISELAEAEARELMDRMTEADTWYPPRFSRQNRGPYMAARRRSERHLYEEFVKKGGHPQRLYPYYFFLLTAETGTFYPEAKRVHIPLAVIPSEAISFTYLDSMVCDALLHDPDHVPANCRRFAGLPCLGGVYRREELPALVHEFGLPEGTYMEAQLWDDGPLEPYKKASNHAVERTAGKAAVVHFFTSDDAEDTCCHS